MEGRLPPDGGRPPPRPARRERLTAPLPEAPISTPSAIVVVGAGVAGLRVCEELRARGYAGTLTLLGAELHPPYGRPPLSKEVLRGDVEPATAYLRTVEELTALRVDARLGVTVADLDPAGRTVGLASGERLGYDRLVVATGAAPRRLPGAPDLDGIATLRTLDDAVALRDAFRRRPRVTVVGAGFIGGEVAATARSVGLDVTLVEMLPVPRAGALGEQVGAACARLHTDHGVDLRCGVAVAGVDGDRRVEAVRLSDGSVVASDLVVVGIGVSPVLDWLAGSGIALDNGVVCDEFCRSSLPDVYAAGDVARWFNPRFGEHMRVEHWTNANEQAAAVAANLLGAAEPFAPVPYFWSDQYGTKIQYLGRPGGGEELAVVAGSLDGPKFVGLFRHGDALAGVVGLGSPGKVMRCRQLLVDGAGWDEALAAAA